MYTFLMHKCLLMILISFNFAKGAPDLPMVISTWAFKEATQEAWKILSTKEADALDAIEGGCKSCEELQCDGTVGFGGSPDESGETTLDAMIFDGDTMNVGAVAGLRRIKSAISVARHVFKYTEHSLLAGDLATQFAKDMGFVEESLSTNVSKSMWWEWKSKNCQPNFWTNVFPNPRLSCGPYKPNDSNYIFGPHAFSWAHIDSKNHDTISMIAIDKTGKIAAGSSSNGAKFKIPGRIGDAPISGAAAFADSKVGAAVATGDGDVMMRFSPSAIIVEMMRNGASPRSAASQMIGRIARYYPRFSGAFIAVNKNGDFFAACNGFKNFTFSRASPSLFNVTVSVVKCS